MVEGQIVAIGIVMVIAGAALGALSWAMNARLPARLYPPADRGMVLFLIGLSWAGMFNNSRWAPQGVWRPVVAAGIFLTGGLVLLVRHLWACRPGRSPARWLVQQLPEERFFALVEKALALAEVDATKLADGYKLPDDTVLRTRAGLFGGSLEFEPAHAGERFPEFFERLRELLAASRCAPRPAAARVYFALGALSSGAGMTVLLQVVGS